MTRKRRTVSKIIMYYIIFKIKFLLLAFNLTPFLRKKDCLQARLHLQTVF